jgi:hypothetical protein
VRTPSRALAATTACLIAGLLVLATGSGGWSRGSATDTMSASPLTYRSVDYDFVGLHVHASGEAWSATDVDIRAAMIERYGAGNAALQRSCATGGTQSRGRAELGGSARPRRSLTSSPHYPLTAVTVAVLSFRTRIRRHLPVRPP